MKIKWKDVVGYEGIYKVSSSGKVKVIKTNRYLGVHIRHNGYKGVHLRKNGKRTTILLHRVIASTFLERSPERDQVNHKDCDRENNHVSNLEWCTRRENLEHAYRLGRLSIHAKLTQQKVSAIRNLIKEGRGKTEIARLFGVGLSTIKNIHRGKTWNGALRV